MRILAIGDIHGCSRALDLLLAEVKLTADDQLITLGDYIDRGPDARGVLNRLLQLHKDHRVVSLRGNHEVMMIEARNLYGKTRSWLRGGGRQTLDSYAYNGIEPTINDIPEEHWEFVEDTLVDWYETEHHFYVHANAYPDLELAEQPAYMLQWEKLGATRPHCSGKVMICGHTPQVSGLPLNREHVICIDTGSHRPGGWVTCLDVVSGRFWQANQKGEKRTSQIDLFQD